MCGLDNESLFARVIREAMRRQQEEEHKRNLFSSLLSAKSQTNLFSNTLLTSGMLQAKRKVFISYHHGDDMEVKAFVKKWADFHKVFIPKGLGLRFTDDIIKSNNPEYVMSQIRKNYLQDSSVTIALIGTCTHSRRYVDWEIKTSLRQGIGYTPNGLIGIILPSKGREAYLPPRLEDNWTKGHINCYARLYMAPQSASQLGSWINDAYNARTSRTKLINNSSDIMKNNAQCQICGYVHPA